MSDKAIAATHSTLVQTPHAIARFIASSPAPLTTFIVANTFRRIPRPTGTKKENYIFYSCLLTESPKMRPESGAS